MVNWLHFAALILSIIAALCMLLPPPVNRLANLQQQGLSELGKDPVLMVGMIFWAVACLCAIVVGFYRGRNRLR